MRGVGNYSYRSVAALLELLLYETGADKIEISMSKGSVDLHIKSLYADREGRDTSMSLQFLREVDFRFSLHDIVVHSLSNSGKVVTNGG